MTKEVQQAAATPSRRCVPQGDQDQANHTVTIAFIVEEGPHVYIERINIRGNTATRDYVIRREFDIGEGDAYNKALIDKAERRLNALGYFKKVKITNEPGSSPDRVIVDVDVEEQSTGIVLGLGRLFDRSRASSPKSRSPRATSSAAANLSAPRFRPANTPAASNSITPSPSSSTIAWRRASTSIRRSVEASYLRLLFELGHRRHAAPRHSAHRRHDDRAALYAL